jgi:hypothetical protein
MSGRSGRTSDRLASGRGHHLPTGGYTARMTATPPEPVEDDSSPQDDDDQDAEPTSTAPEENNPTVPDPPD